MSHGQLHSWLSAEDLRAAFNTTRICLTSL